MMALFSFKFWVFAQLIIDLFIIFGMLIIVRRINRGDGNVFAEDKAGGFDHKIQAEKTVDNIIEMMEPFVKESKATAKSFDKQIKEKRKLIKELNESLDSRIISLNLLISRAEAAKEDLRNLKIEVDRQSSQVFLPQKNPDVSENVLDQQAQIMDLFDRGYDAESIASKLSMPKGEVKLVVDLKEKFKAMELKE